MSGNNENIILEFTGECDELCSHISSLLKMLDDATSHGEIIDAIYRDVHTLKGSANLFGFKQMGTLMHLLESGLDPFRQKSKSLTSDIVDLVYRCLDVLEIIIKTASKVGSEPDLSAEMNILVPRLIDVGAQGTEREKPLYKEVGPLQEDLSLSGVNESKYDTTSVNQQPVLEIRQHKMPSKSGEEKMTTSEKTSDSAVEKTSATDANSTIRVHISILDKLMNLVSEMVLARNQVLQFSNMSEDLEFVKVSQHLNLVTAELQDNVMKTRMQPIGNILDKFHRVVRDLSKELGKKIELVLEGTETEFDRSLLEAIKDPLTHLLRNSCDHGVESPDERRASGKNETGKITIKAFHEGGQVVIEIVDDGKGLVRGKILEKAIEKSLVDAERGKELSDQQVYNFIFEPGFSTAQKVSTVSGRGVGMDVVRTNIEKIGGTIDLQSVTGKGTKIQLQIPLTLAIVPALIVSTQGSRFAIPQVKLVELVRASFKNTDLHASEVRNEIEILQGKPMFRLRGELLPLVDLNEVLSRAAREKSGEMNIVVLDAGGRQFGLIVDEIQDTCDIVVKPLAKFIKSIALYSGATIMGDGQVALILDVSGIAETSDIHSKNNKLDAINLDEYANVKISQNQQEFLLLKTRGKGKYAVALCLVHRLEEFNNELIEFSGEQKVVRYRGEILPLIFLNDFLGFSDTGDTNAKDIFSVVVVQKHNKNFGLVVDSVIDVTSIDGMIDDSLRDRTGVLGNIIHDQEVVVVLDPLCIIDAEVEKFNRGQPKVEKQRLDLRLNIKNRKMKILLAEDFAFFRKHISRALEQEGFEVETAFDGAEALRIVESSPLGTFAAIVSDIEMPHMTGFQLAAAVRAIPGMESVPMIAVTTRFRDSDIDEGKRVGFTAYLEKFNAEQLTSTLFRLLNLNREAA